MMDNNYGAPIHHSLTRPQTILGCDRELFLSLLIVCALLIVPTGIMKGQMHAVIFCVVLWIGGQIGLAAMGKRDPQMRHVFMRSLKYKSSYLAASPIPDTYKPEYRRW